MNTTPITDHRPRLKNVKIVKDEATLSKTPIVRLQLFSQDSEAIATITWIYYDIVSESEFRLLARFKFKLPAGACSTRLVLYKLRLGRLTVKCNFGYVSSLNTQSYCNAGNEVSSSEF